ASLEQQPIALQNTRCGIVGQPTNRSKSRLNAIHMTRINGCLILLCLFVFISVERSVAQAVATGDPLAVYADGIPPIIEKVLTDADTAGVNLRTLVFRYTITSIDDSI